LGAVMTDSEQTSHESIAFVTGAGSGIGRATSLRLLEQGYRVAAFDVDESGLEETRGLGGSQHLSPVHVDLAVPKSLTDATKSAVDRLGVPDLLVNNAGVGVYGSAPQTTAQDWDRTIAVNLSAVFHLCSLLIPPMIDRGGGVIVNVASVAGLVGLTNRAAYCASKAGVVGLTRALAADHAADGLRVNAICPGTIETAWVDRIIAGAEDPEAARAAMAARQLDGRMGTAEEVAAGIVFLASPEARFVNGSAFVMDGGLTAV